MSTETIPCAVSDFFTRATSPQACRALKNVAEKGRALLADGYVVTTATGRTYAVKSPVGIQYFVTYNVEAQRFDCTCPDHRKTGRPCKHLFGVHLMKTAIDAQPAPATFVPRVQFALPEPVAAGVARGDIRRLDRFAADAAPRSFGFWLEAAGYDAEMALIDSAEDTRTGCDPYAWRKLGENSPFVDYYENSNHEMDLRIHPAGAARLAELEGWTKWPHESATSV